MVVQLAGGLAAPCKAPAPPPPPPPSALTAVAYEQEFDKVVIVLAFGHIFDGDSDGLRAALLAGALA